MQITGAEYNRKLAYELCETWSIEKGGDVEPYFALFHDDAVFEAMVNTELSPKLKGPWTKQQWRAYLSAQIKVFGIKYIVTGVTAEGNRIAIEAVTDVNIDGHPYKNPYHFLVEVRDGKIATLRFYMDTLYAQQAFGWIEDAFAKAGVGAPPASIQATAATP